VALLLAMALVGAACSSDSEQSTTSQPAASQPATRQSTTSQPTASPSTTSAATSAPSDDAEPADAASAPGDGSGWRPSLSRTYDVTVTKDVVYGQGEVEGGGFTDLLLDLYVPAVSGQDTFPLVVTIHGGGFSAGSKDNTAFESERFAQRGYIVAAIDYRLSGDAPVLTSRFDLVYEALNRSDLPDDETAVLAAMDDTMTALEFLHARPDVEPSQTVLWGFSAGAITALFVGHGMDELGIERPPVAAVISNSGGFVGERSAADFIDENRGLDQDLGYPYSEGPIFLSHATGDTVVPYQLSQDIVDRATAVGHPHERFSVESDSHRLPGGMFNTEYAPGVSLFQAQVNWLDSFLFGGSGS